MASALDLATHQNPASNAENGWARSPNRREPAELMKPLVDPAGWYPDELRGRPVWIYSLSGAEQSDILDSVDAFQARGTPLKDATRDDFPLPILGRGLRDIRAELLDGRGFALLRGLPTAGRSLAQTAAAFWAIGSHMGRVTSQNSQGHLLGHVKDLGGDYAKVRGYTTRAEMKFHCDSADILSLCCLHPAKAGGAHRICSSVTIYNEMLKRHPELVRELTFRFYRTRKGSIPPGETEPWVREPIFSVQDGYFAARGAGAFLFKAQKLDAVPKLTDAQREAIRVYYEIADTVAIDIEFQPGDISFVMNHVTLHSRSAYEDWPEEHRKRHLLRLWLTTDGARPMHPDIAREHRGVLADDAVLKAPLEP